MIKFIRDNKYKFLISSVIILLPILAGLVLWGDLPSQMPIHFSADGTADSYASKTFTVIGMPIILLVLHFICVLYTAHDNRAAAQTARAFNLAFLISPVVSVVVSGVIYISALGGKVVATETVPAITAVIIGFMLVLFGNSMPKLTRNRSMGIKTPWTVRDDRVWYKTHRLGARLWVAGGIVIILSVLLPEKVFICILVAVLLAISVIPAVYSYVIYNKKNRR